MKLSPELQREFDRIMAHIRAFINRSIAQTERRRAEKSKRSEQK